MHIDEAKFLGSFQKADDCPAGEIPEYAFIGRSNVGKSSLINYLTGRQQLAKISSTPGKTQSLNIFLINNQWRLADLPGYGYAKVSKVTREKWEKMIRYYLLKRETLACIFLLIDSRIPPQASDLAFIHWLGSVSLPFAIVFTKADKPNSPLIRDNIQAFNLELQKEWETLPRSFITSSTGRAGKEEILHFIEDVNSSFKQ